MDNAVGLAYVTAVLGFAFLGLLTGIAVASLTGTQLRTKAGMTTVVLGTILGPVLGIAVLVQSPPWTLDFILSASVFGFASLGFLIGIAVGTLLASLTGTQLRSRAGTAIVILGTTLGAVLGIAVWQFVILSPPRM